MGDSRRNSETDSGRKRRVGGSNTYPETKKKDVDYTGCSRNIGNGRKRNLNDTNKNRK